MYWGIFLIFFWVVRSSPISVNTATRALEDEYGRERLFHGVNVVYKTFPYFPITDHFDSRYSFCEQDLEYLEEWGLNVVRLGVMWPGVEPTRNQFNTTYLEIVEQVIANMSQHGIYALIDCHQDDLSEKFCGEGVPLWAAQPNNASDAKFPLPIAKPYNVSVDDVPTPEDCAKRNWPDYMFTYAASSAYQNLYSNYDGIRDSFAAYWQKLASIFVNYDNVIGYELINEPFAGDIFKNPDLMVPKVADRENLAPMYEILNDAIRQVDNKHIIFFEPVTWDDLGVGFENVPGGDAYKNRSVLSYHIYMPPDISAAEAFFVRNGDLERLGCGGFLTEFDIGTDQTNAQVAHTAGLADEYHQSWMGWEYKVYANITGWGYSIFQENGSIDLSRLATVSRTYPMAVAGRTQKIAYNDLTKEFSLTFAPNSAIQQPTDIYLNTQLNYPKGYVVSINPNTVFWNFSQNHIFIWNPQNSATSIVVQVSAQ
eukprot:Phypoly_transcript_07814.p1 GENE.Phypoly_transcript_07814~~Phypoly_transcript_07814.p1  ORF type:complete len:482 (+),score=58.45 Phypoly_transcript_07814:61-1506(+)